MPQVDPFTKVPRFNSQGFGDPLNVIHVIKAVEVSQTIF
jgi:hypothetical protein